MKRFIDCLIPFQTCNLRCHYCYITQTKSFGQKLPVFPYGADHIGRALSVERLGGASLINICGEGETLLPPEVVGIVHAILKQGHYVMVVTNGTVAKRFDEIAALPADCLDRLFIKFSFHYLELKKRGWLDLFFDNVQKIRKAGASFSVELTPSDEMIPHIDDAMALCRARVGAPCHVTVARDETRPELTILTRHSPAEYREIWNRFDSDLFRFKMSVFGEKRREFCCGTLVGVSQPGDGRSQAVLLRKTDPEHLRGPGAPHPVLPGGAPLLLAALLQCARVHDAGAGALESDAAFCGDAEPGLRGWNRVADAPHEELHRPEARR